jgi:cytochrome b561
MTEKSGYSFMQIGLHWLIVVLIAVNYFVSDGMGRALRDQINGQAVTGITPTIHVYVGVAVLVLVLIRLGFRLASGAPHAPVSGPPILNTLSKWAHWALYLLMFLVPIAGALAWYLGIREAGDFHVVTMNAMIILAGLHAAAALFHQYVLKDGLLMRMVRPS